jgi:UDP-glucuronate 4-epimerase
MITRRLRIVFSVLAVIPLLRAWPSDIIPAHSGKKTVLLTGGAGFVGSHVAEQLLNRGDDVVIVDEINDYYDTGIKESNLRNLREKYGDQRVKVYRDDLCNASMLAELFETEKPEWLVHLAARAGVRSSIEDPFLYVHSNVRATVNLLQFSQKHGVRNIVFASSSSVYGGSKSTFFDETENVNRPISPYAATKKAGELLLYTYHHLYGLNTTALRFFTVYGPRGRPDMAPFKFIDSVSKGEAIQQFGDGSSSRDYTYVEDIAKGVLLALDRTYPYEIFNLGKGDGTKLSEFITLVERYVGKKANIEYLPDQPGDVPFTCANVTKAQVYLGYQPNVTFEEGIRRTAEWYKSVFPDTQSSKQLRGLAARPGRTRRLSIPRAAFSKRNPIGSTKTLPWNDVPLVEPHIGKKTVLLTGGAGFIGSHVADQLLARGDDVIIVDEVNDYYDLSIKESNLQMIVGKYGTSRVQIYRADICDTNVMQQIFETHRPEWLVHLAARAGVRPSIQDPLLYVHSNVEGTLRLLDLSRLYGVKNFVLASSSSVYGGSKSTYFSENEVTDNPISPYAATKISSELMAYTYHHLFGLNITALRFFTVFGPRGRPDMAPFTFIDRISRGKTIQQFGDGTSSRDYTYVDDIANGVLRALDRPYPYQIFNLGKGSGTSLSDFVRTVEKYVGRSANIEVLPDQPGDVPRTCADVRKAERLLGYKSQVSFDEGIRRTVEWYQQTYPIVRGNDTGSSQSGLSHATATTNDRSGTGSSSKVESRFSVDDLFLSDWPCSLAYVQWALLVAFLIRRFWHKSKLSFNKHSK